jgi:hypothetical protein
MITSDLIERRINNFWGYGSLDAPVWLVGMEEGLGDTDNEELEARFRATNGKTTVDIRLDMKNVPGHMKWFQPQAQPQFTWKYPIALYLYMKDGNPPSPTEILTCQIHSFGDVDLKQTAVLELMPLPEGSKGSPDTWRYHDYVDRKTYLGRVYKNNRANQLKNMIEKYRPQLVILYSLTLRPQWSIIIGAPVEEGEVTYGMYFFNQTNRAAFCVIPHSNQRANPERSIPRMSYERLYEYAALIKPKVNLRIQ